MRTLIYKRTHPGDPDAAGRFGIHDCMGQVRSWDFDAVIGVGGIGVEASSHRIDGRVNWIGIGAHKAFVASGRGPVVTFDRFVLYESEGPNLAELAPMLARRLYERNTRVVLHGLTPRERKEVARILALVGRAGRASRPVRGKRRERRARACDAAGCRT